MQKAAWAFALFQLCGVAYQIALWCSEAVSGPGCMDGRTNRGYWCGGAFPWWQEGQEISRDCVAVAFFLQYVAIAFAQFYIVFPRLRGLRWLCLTARALTSSHQLSQVKWVEGVFEKESKSSDFPTIILDSLISLQLSHAVSLYCLSLRS